MRSLLCIALFLPLGLFAQLLPHDVLPGADTGDQPRTMPQGVIKVRKPKVRPFFKCEYYLTLCRVREVEILVPAANGIPGVYERDRVPVFDSAISAANERVYPQKSMHFSRLLADSILFSYAFEDTASIDTMVVELWIGTNGKLKWTRPDTLNNGDMPRELQRELFFITRNLRDWGRGGGYKEPKRFLRKQHRMAGNYYGVLYIIVSAKPLTPEQKHTGVRWASFDIPLNSPPENEQQRDFIEGDKKRKDGTHN